jgi:hypothetical protein
MQRELVVRYWRWKLSEELPWLIFPHHKGKSKTKAKADDRQTKTPVPEARVEKADDSASQKPPAAGRGAVPAPAGE